MIKYDLVIVGGGPAGLAAAVSAKENGIGILSSLTLGVSIMNDVQPIFAYEKNTENKNIKKVEKSKKETKKDKAFNLSKIQTTNIRYK